MQSTNQLTSHVFSDKKLTPLQAEMAQIQIGKNNKMLFHLITVLVEINVNKGTLRRSR